MMRISKRDFPNNQIIMASIFEYDFDKNKLNRLQVAAHPDKKLVKDQSAIIKKGGTVSGAVAYKLADLSTPVKLTAFKGVDGIELGSQEFAVK